MPTRTLQKEQLEGYFNRVSRSLGTRDVRIEVASLDLGDQIAAEWVGLTKLSYDPHNDVIDVGGDDLDHRIARPYVVHVEEGEHGLEAVEVERGDGVKEIIRLSEPLLLPGPAA